MGSADCADPGEGRLPYALARMLEPELQDALDHPVRREILRQMGGRGEPTPIPVELAVRLAPWRLRHLNYHVNVLADAGALVDDGEDLPRGEMPYLDHLSRLCERPQVVAILQATERPDRERWESVDSGFPAAGPDL